jgi:transposase
MTDLTAIAARLDELESGQARLQQQLQQALQERDELARERDAYKQLYHDMQERCRKLELGLLADRASEKLPRDDNQLTLSIIDMMLSERQRDEIEALAPQKVREHERRKPTGRRPLPEHLRRVEIEVLPEEVKREGLDAFEEISAEVTEVLERQIGGFVVVRIRKPKFKRKNALSSDITVGSTPMLPIERGVAGPGLLADTIVRRWQDHLPLHRLEGIYKRDGVEIARSTMCQWHQALAELVQVLISAMRADAFAQPYLCTDATGVLVQAKNKCRRSHFWVLVAPRKHVLFEYTRKHDSDAVDMVLAGYEGYLVADAHAVYDHLYESGDVHEVNCWAHARRYFFKALTSQPEEAKIALELMGLLFKIERSQAASPPKKRKEVRDKHSKPVVDRFFSWADEIWPRTLEDTPLHDGVRYARNQREGLQRFLSDGRLPLHNNVSERALRRQAVGRKNWLFVGSDSGAEANAAFTSLLASCGMHGIEPWSYLRDLFCLLPRWPAHRALELAPAYWKQALEDERVLQLLAADPYRAASLGRDPP